MAFAVVHMQKIKAGGIRGIQSHVNREHPPKTNPDIDAKRTPLNYDLHPQDNFYQYIKNTIKNSAPKTKTVRKDAVVMCGFIVTSDEQTMKAMSPDKQRAFFKDSLKWFANRYGKENIVNATVHMDETTPHMHLSIVPITGERLSAKALFNRKELTAIQTEFAQDVGKKYGLERGREGSTNTHLTTKQMKLETIKRETAQMLTRYQQATVECREVEDMVSMLRKQEKALGGNITALQDELNDMSLSTEEIEATRPQKTITGAVKGVSIAQVQGYRKTSLLLSYENKKLKTENKRLATELKKANQLIPSIESQMREADKISQLKQEIDFYKRLFNAVPPEVQREVMGMDEPEQENDFTLEL